MVTFEPSNRVKAVVVKVAKEPLQATGAFPVLKVYCRHACRAKLTLPFVDH